jgi:hypothetical protein
VSVTVIAWPGLTVLSLGPAEVDFVSDPVARPLKTPEHE